LIKLARGASINATPRGVYLVLSGSGIVGEVPYRRLTAFHIDVDEAASIAARDETELLCLVLPDLAGLTAHAQVEAAE
jgi:hypothetical protein